MTYQPPISRSLQSTFEVFLTCHLIVELNAEDTEAYLGGSFTGDDRLRSRLQAEDNSTTSIASQYGIRSIPTLMI
ncbi:hypothetical protein [Pantanalinema rosaneae]|uniref:hypothetical protein n=1 Tax=Pantanalinema rosaneae TaxID=1620701 RepID=UPI003D6E4CAE